MDILSTPLCEILVASYQLDLVTPGMSPLEAMDLKQILHTPNFLRKALGLPHMGHLLYFLTLNLGLRWALKSNAFLDTPTSLTTS